MAVNRGVRCLILVTENRSLFCIRNPRLRYCVESSGTLNSTIPYHTVSGIILQHPTQTRRQRSLKLGEQMQRELRIKAPYPDGWRLHIPDINHSVLAKERAACRMRRQSEMCRAKALRVRVRQFARVCFLASRPRTPHI